MSNPMKELTSKLHTRIRKFECLRENSHSKPLSHSVHLLNVLCLSKLCYQSFGMESVWNWVMYLPSRKESKLCLTCTCRYHKLLSDDRSTCEYRVNNDWLSHLEYHVVHLREWLRARRRWPALHHMQPLQRHDRAVDERRQQLFSYSTC